MSSLKLAVRALWSSRLSSSAALVSFALGIGASVGVFFVLDALLFRPLPVSHPEQLVTISSDTALGMGFDAGIGWNYGMWTRLRDRRDLAAGTLAWTRETLGMSADSTSREPVDALVADGLIETLGLPVAIGRPIAAVDEAKGGGPDGPVAMLSDAFWQRRFGGDRSVVGSRLRLERTDFTVVGVTPPGFLGVEAGRGFDVIVPLGTTVLLHPGRSLIDQPESLLLLPMLRLRPGQSLAAATATIRAAQADLVGSGRLPPFVHAPFVLVPAARGVSNGGSDVRSHYTRALTVMLAVAAFVFLLACCNIANLLLARGVARRREFGIHLALGARPRDLVRTMAIESAMLVAVGSAIGLLGAIVGSRALVRAVSTPVSRIALSLNLDWRVLVFTVGVATAAAIFFGTVGAVQASRIPAVEVLRSAVGVRRRRTLGGVLLVVQVAASYALVAAAGLLIATYGGLAHRPLGFVPDRTLVASVDTSTARVSGSRVDLFENLVKATRAAPGVVAAGASLQAPIGGGLPQRMARAGDADSKAVALVRAVTPDWFRTMGAALERGRDFDEHDTASAEPVAIVNAAFVRDVLRGGDPLAETVNDRRIVGVVASAAVTGGFRPNGAPWSLRDDPPPAFYVPLTQAAGTTAPGRTTVTIIARARNDTPASIAPQVSAALMAVDHELAVSLRPLQADVDAALTQEHVVAWLSAVFAVVGLVLAGVGLYAMTGFTVSRERRAIAIRLALGATRGRMFGDVLQRVGVSVLLGFAAGVGTTCWLSKYVSSLVYGISSRDPETMSLAAVALVVVGLAAALGPARRASRVEPAEILRGL